MQSLAAAAAQIFPESVSVLACEQVVAAVSGDVRGLRLCRWQ